MSKISELSLDIQEMLAEEHDPRAIARYLDIPAEWVYEELSREIEEAFSPFETCNS